MLTKRHCYVNGKFISSDLCFIITPKDQENLPVDLKFYHILFNELKDEIVRNTKAGTSKEAIGLGSFGKYQLPYFDIDTQIEIKNRFVNAEELKSEISSELIHQVDLVKKLRQQILQDAVQGKLLSELGEKGLKDDKIKTHILQSNNPKNHNSDNGHELLKKIKAEKEKLIAEKRIKKEKELSPIKAEEIPFEIPENWVWCRLGEIALYSEAGKSYQAQEISANESQIGVIKTSAITSGIFIEDENKLLPNQNVSIEKIKILKDDLIFCRASGSKGLAGKSCLVKNTPKAKLILSDKSIRYVFSDNISKIYIQCFNSSYFAEQYYINLGTKKSTTMNNITREQFNNLPIPLPPLSEQNRIVQNLYELMQYCNELEASIKQSEAQNEKLLQQVLREALRKEPVGEEV